VQYAKDKLDALVTQAEWAPVSPLRNRVLAALFQQHRGA